VSREH